MVYLQRLILIFDLSILILKTRIDKRMMVYLQGLGLIFSSSSFLDNQDLIFLPG